LIDLEINGAPGEIRTPDPLVRRGKLRYTPTHAVQQEPMKSARKAKSFRLVSDGFVHRSRTITRTKASGVQTTCCNPEVLRFRIDTSPAPASIRKRELGSGVAACGVRDPEVRLNVALGEGPAKNEMNVQVKLSLQSGPPE
jgi:hypothetical protein